MRILITGANSGIGLAILQKLYENHEIIAVSRNIHNIPKHNNVTPYQIDIRNYSELQELFKNLERVDVVINNAGVAYYDTLDKLPHDKIHEMLDINIFGFTNVLELCLPKLYNQRNGTIINVSSLADRYPRPKSAVYAATKAYVKSVSESIRVESSKYGVRVINVSPSMINTPLLQRIKPIKDGLINTDEFADIISFILNLPSHVNIRDLVVAPTSYEG